MNFWVAEGLITILDLHCLHFLLFTHPYDTIFTHVYVSSVFLILLMQNVFSRNKEIHRKAQTKWPYMGVGASQHGDLYNLIAENLLLFEFVKQIGVSLENLRLL